MITREHTEFHVSVSEPISIDNINIARSKYIELKGYPATEILLSPGALMHLCKTTKVPVPIHLDSVQVEGLDIKIRHDLANGAWLVGTSKLRVTEVKD